MSSIDLLWKHYDGISALDADRSELKQSGGVYLWISKSTPKRVIYVGETQNFLQRFAHHFTEQISGRYMEYFFNPKEDMLLFWAREIYESGMDVKKLTMPGLQSNGKINCGVSWDHDNFSLQKIIPSKERMLERLSFFANLEFATAKLNVEITRREAEGLLQEHLSAVYANEISKILHQPVKPLVVPGAKSNSYLIGTRLRMPEGQYEDLNHSGDVEHLPQEVIFNRLKNQAA